MTDVKKRPTEAKKRRPRGPTDRSEAKTYTVPQYAKLLGIGRSQGYEAARRGEIPAIKIGGRYVVPRAAGDRLLGLAPDTE